jgi:hypothetical protein
MLGGRLLEKQPPGRLRIWEANIKIDLKENNL